MRITLGMMADQSLRNIQANQARIQTLQDQLTSGTQITKPSDDPIGAAQALSLSEAAAGMRHLRALRRLRTVLGETPSLCG